MVVALFACIGISLQAQPYNVTTAQTCSFVTGGSVTVTFPNTPASAASDATLTILASGDIDIAGTEFLTYFGEGSTLLGQSPNATQCSGVSTFTYTIPLATVSSWAANGSIDITANSNTSVNALGNCVNGQTVSFCITATLSYASVSGPNDAGVSALTSPSLPVCAGTYPVSATIQNYGSNTINPVSVGWSINGVSQTGASYTSTLDTINGTGNNTASISLGNVTIGSTPVTLKVWTSNPNNTADTINVNDTLTIVYAASLNGTYTIGSTGADFSSIQAAVTALNNFGVCGPVVFHLDDGTYNESIEIGDINGVSSVNTITFKSDPTNTALANQVYSSTSSATNFLWRFTNNAEYITLDSFSMTATGTSFGRVIDFTGSTENITIRNAVLTSPNTTTTSTLMAVVMNNSGTANMNNNCLLENNQINGGSYSLYWWGGSTISTGLEQNNRFIGNSFNNFYYMGVYFYYQNDLIFNNNYLESAGTYTSTTNGYGLYRVYNDGACEIIGNTFNYTNPGGWVMRSNLCDATAGSPAIIANNFVASTNATTTGTVHGLYTTSSNHQKYFHNNVSIIAGGQNGYGFYVSNSGTIYQGCESKNNIVSVTGSARALYVSSGNLSSDYNSYFYPNSTLGFYNGNYNNLALMQTGASSDANSLEVDPIFTNTSTGDLHIANTSLNGVGTPVGILVDIDGQVRTTTPDIGADEITVPNNDVAAFQLLSPFNPFCGDSANVEVVIGNFGLNTLTSATVNWSINGTAQTAFSWTGTLLSTELDTISLGTNAFSSGDDLVIWTSLPNGLPDSNALFDTVSISIMSGLSGAYSIPGDFATISGAVDTLNMIGTCDTVWFDIANGNYDDAVTISQFPRNNAAAPVVFRSASGDSANVTWTTSSEIATITLNGADYIWFEDLTISNTNTGGQRVVEISGGAEYNMITRSHLIGVSTTTTSNLFSTLYNAPGIDGYNKFHDNTIENGSYGIYSYGSSTTDLEAGTVIEGNTIINFYYMGIYNYFQDGIAINKNTLTSTSPFTTMYGIYNIWCAGDFQMNGNHVYPTAGTDGFYMAAYLSSCDGTSPFDRGSIANNIFIAGREGETGLVYGLFMSTAAFKNVYHNTIVVLDGGTTARALYSSNSNGCEYLNNIYAVLPVGSSSTLGGGQALYYVSGALFNSDHNNFYTGGGNPIYFLTNYQNLGAYQAGTQNDMNSFAVNPNFADTLLGILCNDTLDATAMAVSIMEDFGGLVRSATTPDIGAREFVGLQNFSLVSDTICGSTYEVFAPEVSQWSVNGASSTGLSVELSAQNAPVTFNITASFSSVCSVDTLGNLIPISESGSVRLVPDASLDSALHLCANEDVNLAPGGGATATYSWFPTAEVTSQINVDAPGVYSVTKSEDGCISQASITVTQSDDLSLVDAEACNADLPFTVNATIFGGNSYNWSGGASTSTAQNDFTASGDYAITATDSFGCTVVDTFSLEVIDVPVAVIANDSHSSNLFFFSSNASQGVGSNAIYFWNFGDGDTSSAANPTHLFPWSGQPQTFTVTLTITNDCGTSETVSFDITSDPLGINAAPSLNDLTIYPNPSNGLITINGEFNSTSLDAQVLDLSGRVVLDLSNVNTASNQVMLDLQGLAAGSYHVKLIDGANVSIGQIIIQ